MAFTLTGARIFDGEAFHDGYAVIIDGARIKDVVGRDKIPAGIEVRHLPGGLLAPGFIDVQVNGGGGALLNGDPSVETVRRIAESHRAFGTVGLLPTVITDAQSVREGAIAAVREACQQSVPGVLGIHIEGPFLDVARKGAHDKRFIRDMAEDDVEAIAATDCGITMLTLAPNRVPPQLVRKLSERGVLVSLGHSDASFAEAEGAVQAGARAFTHLFNAMSQMTGREPGMAGAALALDDAYVGIIADGHHIHDAAMKVAFDAKHQGRMMLITDAMPPAAGGPDHYELQGRKVTRANGRLQLEDGTLAGSNLTMDEAVRHCVHHLGLDLGHVLRMASMNPAAFLRVDHELGRIASGFLASLVHLGDDLRVFNTWIEGR